MGAYAQNITGRVMMPDGQTSLSSTLTLHTSADSQVVKYSAVDENGEYIFDNIQPGDYYIKAEELGYAEGYSEKFTMQQSDIRMPDIIIDVITTTYEVVDVLYKKPIIELRPDMTVFNVDSTINSVGLDAFELLRKSPGVVIDKDDNISLNGKTGLIVMINGRVTPMTGKELSDYLRSIPSNTIDKIELISNPSAKYDASGNAGIINIRLKKNDNVGVNGTVNLGFSRGHYSRYDGGFNINRRTDKTNIHASYSYRGGDNWSEHYLNREMPDSLYSSVNTGKMSGNAHNYKAGMDYYATDKSTFGILVQGIAQEYDYSSHNHHDITTPTHELIRYYTIDNTQKGSRNNINGNLNYAYKDDKKGTSFTWDVDYGYYDIQALRTFPYTYFNKEGVQTSQVSQQYDMPVVINMLSTKADYERNLWKGKLSTGFKITNVNTDNNQVTQWDRGTGWEYSPLESNEYDYRENIQAVYGQYQEQVKNFNYYVGLRLENTITKGHSVGQYEKDGALLPFDSTIKRNYLGLFPNAGITYNKNPMNQWSLNYSRRIDRPNYQDLNPFVFRVDDYFDRVGNGYLKPQISNKFSLGHTYKYMINTRLEYTHTKDLFGELVDTMGERLNQSKQNINSMDMVSLNVSIPYRWKALSVFANFNAYYAHYQSDFGVNRDIDLDVFALNVYGQVSYAIKPWLTAEVSGWYASPSIFMGTFKSIAMGGVDAGLQARVLDNKGTLKLSVGDVFKTMKWGGASNFVGQSVAAHGYWESQKVSLNFSYNFGNNKIKSRNRATGIEDEKSRVGGDGAQGAGGVNGVQ